MTAPKIRPKFGCKTTRHRLKFEIARDESTEIASVKNVVAMTATQSDSFPFGGLPFIGSTGATRAFMAQTNTTTKIGSAIKTARRSVIDRSGRVALVIFVIGNSSAPVVSEALCLSLSQPSLHPSGHSLGLVSFPTAPELSHSRRRFWPAETGSR